MAAGFYNIDIGTPRRSWTSTRDRWMSSQHVNYTLAAHFTHYIRSLQFGDLTVLCRRRDR